MNRREFSIFLGGAAAACQRRAYAQQQAGPSNPVRRDWLDRRKEPISNPNCRSSIRITICGSVLDGGICPRIDLAFSSEHLRFSSVSPLRLRMGA